MAGLTPTEAAERMSKSSRPEHYAQSVKDQIEDLECDHEYYVNKVRNTELRMEYLKELQAALEKHGIKAPPPPPIPTCSVCGEEYFPGDTECSQCVEDETRDDSLEETMTCSITKPGS